MKLIFKTILIGVLAFIIQQMFSWWTAALAAAIIAALIPTSGFKAFVSGFFGVGLLWLGLALISSIHTDFLLTERVARLFTLESGYLIIVASFLIGAILGGLGAWSGNQLRQVLRTDTKRASGYKRTSRRRI
jgi:hypothetical protein